MVKLGDFIQKNRDQEHIVCLHVLRRHMHVPIQAVAGNHQRNNQVDQNQCCHENVRGYFDPEVRALPPVQEAKNRDQAR